MNVGRPAVGRVVPRPASVLRLCVALFNVMISARIRGGPFIAVMVRERCAVRNCAQTEMAESQQHRPKWVGLPVRDLHRRAILVLHCAF